MLFGHQEHAHLRLTSASEPMPRARPQRGGGQGRAYPDHKSHARDIEAYLAGVRERFGQRQPILGVTPELVMVIEFNQKVGNVYEVIEQAGLQVLGATEEQALAAFSNDPEMQEFLARLRSYRDELTPKGKKPRHERLFDVIDRIRPLEPEDVVDAEVLDSIGGVSGDQVLRVDIECWCTEREDDTRRRHMETITALTAAGGVVLDSSCRFDVGFSAIRADVPAASILTVVEIERVSRVSLLPRPLLTTSEIRLWTIDELPVVTSPAENAPVAAVIDSGVQGDHPLIAPVLVDAVSAAPELIGDGADEHGHGTLVASLAIYGSIEQHLVEHAELRPAGRLLSIRVLDEDNQFPEAQLWVRQLEAAVELAAAEGARVVNISICDPRHPYVSPQPVAAAATLDRLIRDHDLIVVLCAGNVHAEEFDGTSYTVDQLQRSERRLAPPAMASLALTVGALVPDSAQGARVARETVSVLPLGKPGQPSPVSRVGPGIEYAIKPELSAPGGTYVHDRDTGDVRKDHARGTVAGASGGNPERILALDVGTSFAAPLISHAALRVLGRYPQLSANAVRALVLASTEQVDLVVDHESQNAAWKVQRWWSGFGRASAERAEASNDQRAVLLAEETIAADQVHFYELSTPACFMRNGRKSLTVALAFDPETRATRLKYLASRMSVYAYRGVSVQDVQAKFAASQGEPPQELDGARIDLQPSDQDRLLGANQAAHAGWQRGWDGERHGTVVFVVRNTRRWPNHDFEQRYALAVALEMPEDLVGPYAELRAQFEALVEVEIETEI